MSCADICYGSEPVLRLRYCRNSIFHLRHKQGKSHSKYSNTNMAEEAESSGKCPVGDSYKLGKPPSPDCDVENNPPSDLLTPTK